MLDEKTPAPMGHNSAAVLPYDIEKFQPLEMRARDIADAGAEWMKLEKIEDEEQAQKANDFLGQVKKIEKDVEAERRVQKKPHEDQAKAVDLAFKSLTDPLSKIAGGVKPKLLRFAEEKAEAERLEKARLADEARKAEEAAAAKLAQAQQRGDVFGEAEAEAEAKDAQKMAKAAAKETKTQVKSATGGGRTMAVRTTYRAEVENMNKAFSFFRDHERYGKAVRELFIRMAEAERRSVEGTDQIPGITFHEERNIA